MAGYCVEADVVSYAQTASDYTASTIPTQTQVEAFIDRRCGEIYAWMRDVIGDTAPGSSDFSVTVDTSTDAGIALDRVLTMANAIGAAIDALQAAAVGDEPARSERVTELMAMYDGTGVDGSGLKGVIQEAAMALDGETSDSATHISTGEITAATVVNKTEEGLPFDSGTEW